MFRWKGKAGKGDSFELTPISDADWVNLGGRRGHDNVAKEERLVLYYKFDASRHFVYGYEFSGLTQVSTYKVAGESIDLIAHLLGDSHFDEQIRFLGLSDEQVYDVLQFGTCNASVFTEGGLVRSSGDKLSWMHVSYARALLIDRRLFSDPVAPEFPRAGVNVLDCAVAVAIEKKDLFVARPAVGRVVGDEDPYPPLGDLKTRPLAIIWLYKASIAYNTGLIVPAVVGEDTKREDEWKAIIDWLRLNAPADVARRGWIKTIKTIIPTSYNRSRNFSEAGLASYAASEWIPSDNLSIPVRYVLAICEWWIDQPSAHKSDNVGLAIKLLEAGFQETAMVDLVGMITGKNVSRMKKDAFLVSIDEALRRRALKEMRRNKKKRRVLTRGGNPSAV